MDWLGGRHGINIEKYFSRDTMLNAVTINFEQEKLDYHTENIKIRICGIQKEIEI